MKDKILKAADIAELCGVTEEEVKRITRDFSKTIPSRDFGRVKIYEEKAAGIISKISGLTQKGLSKDEILASVGGSAAIKSTKEKVSEKIRKNPVSAGNRVKILPEGVKDAAEKTLRTAAGKTTLINSKDSDKCGALEIKISKLTARVENLEKEISESKIESRQNYEELKSMILALDEKISISSEWTDYFDKNLDEYKASQDALAKNLSEWTDYLDKEIDELKKPFWRRK